MFNQLIGGEFSSIGESSRRLRVLLGTKGRAMLMTVMMVAMVGPAVRASDVVKTMNPVADAYVRSGFSARKNFGNEPTLEIQSSTVDGTSESYLKFNVSGLDPTLSKARLRVYGKVSSPGSVPVLVRSVAKGDWSEKEIKWRDKPEHIKTVGNLEVVGVSSAWYDLDVTAYLRSELTEGTKELTLALLLGEGSSKKVSIKSREAEGQRPELVVIRKDSNLKIAFLPENGVLPAGYLPDYGKVYGDRGDGYNYGWSQNCSEYMRDRSQPSAGFGSGSAIAAPDHRHELIGHFDHPKMKQPAFWEIGVPNGYYKVHVVSGDPLNFDSVYALDVEDVLTVDAIPETKKRWAEGTKTVLVKDGRLTLKNHATASNNKICFIEIEEATGP